MSDLTPIGEALVASQVNWDGLATAAELRARHTEIQHEYRDRHRDDQTLALQMAWLCLIAIERIRRMEESHHGDRRPSGPDPGPRPAAVQRRQGGGWSSQPTPLSSAPSLRPQ